LRAPLRLAPSPTPPTGPAQPTVLAVEVQVPKAPWMMPLTEPGDLPVQLGHHTAHRPRRNHRPERPAHLPAHLARGHPPRDPLQRAPLDVPLTALISRQKPGPERTLGAAHPRDAKVQRTVPRVDDAPVEAVAVSPRSRRCATVSVRVSLVMARPQELGPLGLHELVEELLRHPAAFPFDLLPGGLLHPLPAVGYAVRPQGGVASLRHLSVLQERNRNTNSKASSLTRSGPFCPAPFGRAGALELRSGYALPPFQRSFPSPNYT